MNTKPPPAIAVRNVSKQFRIPHEKISTLRGAFVHAFKKNTYEEFSAVDDVSFEVQPGEFFGIIGRNGSGKSTLLKMLAGIYEPDSGSIEVNGRISPFLELGIGFNPELSGRDNVYLNATVLGLTNKQITDKFDSIVEFAELERFIDQKLKNYSSGMQVRLAFSVAIHANRDILIMDEVLAVGDANFQQKCLEQFQTYRAAGKTIILVTHDTAMVREYCDRALLLRQGKMITIGKAEDVAAVYMEQNIADESTRLTAEAVDASTPTPIRSSAAHITTVEFLDAQHNSKHLFYTGETIIARIHYKTSQKILQPVFGIALYTPTGAWIAGPNTKTSHYSIPMIEGSGWIDFKIENNPFFTGIIDWTVGLFDWNCIIPYDYQDRAYHTKIVSMEENQYGIIKLPHLWNSPQ